MATRSSKALCTVLLLCYQISAIGEHTPMTPPTPPVPSGRGPDRVAPVGPCAGIDDKVAARIRQNVDGRAARLVVTSFLFAARYAEIKDAPYVKELQARRRGERSLDTEKILTIGGMGAAFLLIGGVSHSSRLVDGRAFGVPGALSVLGASSLGSSAGLGAGRGENEEIAREKAQALRTEVRKRLGELTREYADILRWSSEQSLRFQDGLDEAVRLSWEKKGPDVELLPIDPLDIIRDKSLASAGELDALRALREIAKGKDDVTEETSVATLDEKLRQLGAARRNFETLAKDLEKGGAAYRDCEKLIAEIKKTEEYLRELCELHK